MANVRERIYHRLADRWTILTKLIIGLLIIAIPLYAFNFMLNNLAVDRNRQEITDALQNSVQSYNNIVSSELMRVRDMLSSFSMDVAVAHTDALRYDDASPQRYDLLRSIRKDLNRIQYSNRFITNTIAILPLLHSTVSIANGLSGEVDEDAYAALNRLSDSFVPWQDRLFISVPYETRNSGQPIRFVLAVEISAPYIAAYVSKIMNFKGGGALFYSPGQRWEVSTHNRAELARELQARVAAAPGEGLATPAVATVRLHNEPYVIAYHRSSKLDTVLVAYAPESEIYQSLDVYREWFYGFSLLSVLIIVLCSLWVYKLIHKPLRRIVNAFRKVEIGNMKFALAHSGHDEFAYLYSRFNEMVRRLDDLVHVVADQKIANERSELKRLQAQINPHFLYNNFFVLQNLIRMRQVDQAGKFAGYLGQYFQFVTRHSSDDIPLEEDIRHAKIYEEIQSLSFNSRIAAAFESLPADMAQLAVPRLMVQPIIENSYRHAFEKHLGKGQLSVQFRESERDYRVIVDDNGTALTDDGLARLIERLKASHGDSAETTGMINVHRRLRLKYGGNSGLVLSRSPLGGLRTELVIVIQEGSNRIC